MPVLTSLASCLATLVVAQASGLEAPSIEGLVLNPRDPSTQNRRRAPARRRRPVEQRRDAAQKSVLLDTLWSIMPPPGDPTIAIGLSTGTSFTETAYGASNPNLIGRLTASYDPMRGVPVSLVGSFDYFVYEQTAGDLVYQSSFYTLGVGAGLKYWYGGVRLDLIGELNALLRTSSQTDGRIDPVISTNVSPGLTLTTGGALSLFGFAALTMHGGVRMHGLRSVNLIEDSRVDPIFTLGLEFFPDAQPFDPY